MPRTLLEFIGKQLSYFGQADGEQMVAWGMQNFSDAHAMCGYCLASRSDKPYTDLRATAAWQVTEIGSTMPLLARLRQPHHPLVDAVFSLCGSSG